MEYNEETSVNGLVKKLDDFDGFLLTRAFGQESGSLRASPRAKCIMVGYIDWLYGLCKFFAKGTCICSNGIIYNFACVKLYLKAYLVRQI